MVPLPPSWLLPWQKVLTTLRNDHLTVPTGTVEVASATQNCMVQWFKRSHLQLDELPRMEHRLDISLKPPLILRCRYTSCLVSFNGKIQSIWIKTTDLVNHLRLPFRLLKNQNNLLRMVRWVQLKEIVDPVEERGTIHSSNEFEMALLSMEHGKTIFIPTERVVLTAQKLKKTLRISKKLFPLVETTFTAFPNGMITRNTGKVLGRGNHAKAKMVIGPNRRKLSQRVVAFNLSSESSCRQILHQIVSWTEFMDRVGIVRTYAIGVYENFNGQGKFLLVQERFSGDLSRYLQENSWPEEKERQRMAYQLLSGLVEISLIGVHRNLTLENILIKTDGKFFNAAIGGLRSFLYDHENVGSKAVKKAEEVWMMGNIIYRLLGSQDCLPWIASYDAIRVGGRRNPINEAEVKLVMEETDCPPQIKKLLLGMLDLNEAKRWTAEEALKYFEENILDRSVHSKDHLREVDLDISE